jgi:co-chaperonin GroES (HSP10)
LRTKLGFSADFVFLLSIQNPMNLKIPNLNKLIIVGDRVLIKKTNPNDRTKSGLLLPPGVEEKEDVQSGFVIKVGPGYPIPQAEESENWKQNQEKVKFIPLQAQEGDMAIFLQRQAVEIEFNKQKYYLVPNAALLMLYRDDQ